MARTSFKDNPLYRVAVESGEKVFYEPVNAAMGYHISRRIAAAAQNIYAGSGANKDILKKILGEQIRILNSNTQTKLTDAALLANNLLYRTDYPIDEDCALRMSAIYLFMEGEDPDTVEDTFIQHKVRIAKGDAVLYDFFLIKGITYTPAWDESLKLLEDTKYFQTRQETLRTLLPPSQR